MHWFVPLFFSSFIWLKSNEIAKKKSHFNIFFLSLSCSPNVQNGMAHCSWPRSKCSFCESTGKSHFFIAQQYFSISSNTKYLSIYHGWYMHSKLMSFCVFCSYFFICSVSGNIALVRQKVISIRESCSFFAPLTFQYDFYLPKNEEKKARQANKKPDSPPQAQTEAVSNFGATNFESRTLLVHNLKSTRSFEIWQ